MGKTKRAEDSFDGDSAMMDGRSLSSDQAAQLEGKLIDNPLDIQSRFMLLGYYFRGRDKGEQAELFKRHMVWMIDNRPADKALRSISFNEDSSVFRQVRTRWLRATRLNPDDVRVLENAARCCTLASPKTSEKLWKQAQKLEPLSEEWERELSFLYSLQARDSASASDRKFAKQAIKHAKTMLYLHDKHPKSSYLETYMEMNVGRLAEMALKFNLLEDAKYFGEYLVNRQSIRQTDRIGIKSNSKYKFETHMGHSFLGRAALAEDDVELAKAHLAKMPTLGDPNWRFDLVLATEMLARNEKSATCDYLDGCARNIGKALTRLSKTPANPYRIPALTSIQREEYDPDMDLTDFVRMTLEGKVEQLAKWQKLIKRGRKPTLKEFI